MLIPVTLFAKVFFSPLPNVWSFFTISCFLFVLPSFSFIFLKTDHINHLSHLFLKVYSIYLFYIRNLIIPFWCFCWLYFSCCWIFFICFVIFDCERISLETLSVRILGGLTVEVSLFQRRPVFGFCLPLGRQPNWKHFKFLVWGFQDLSYGQSR